MDAPARPAAPLAPAALARLLSRRVPPDKRQRTAMSCDFCKRKRCKCARTRPDEPCRACVENGEVCRVTEPRKQRILYVEGGGGGGGASENNGPRSTRPVPSPARRRQSMPEDGGAATVRAPTKRTDMVEAVFEDLLGLPQYIGPTGSYTLLVTLREMLAVRYSDQATSPPEAAQTMGLSVTYGSGRPAVPAGALDLPPRAIADMLIETFFARVHRDFPVFHRALFQAAYESMWTPLPERDPAWLMTLYVVFVLALEVAPEGERDRGENDHRRAAQMRYRRHAQALLPEIITGCALGHVQALLLYCVQLHMSRERTACWNLTGAAIRMAVGIGLHRNGANPTCSLLERELRKRVWWTLYAFERLECSSLGRPSAIDDAECSCPVPAEGFLDMGDVLPIGLLDAQADVLRLMGLICRNQYRLHGLHESSPSSSTSNSSSPTSSSSFARDMARQLDAWPRSLPPHLHRGAHAPPLHFRALAVLHLQYHYAVTLLVRPFLAWRMRRDDAGPLPTASAGTVDRLAQQCVEAAMAGVDVLTDLVAHGCFHSKTAWDVYFVESFAMILAVGHVAHEDDADPSLRRRILASLEAAVAVLQSCDGFSATTERFAHVTADFSRTIIAGAQTRTPPQQQPPQQQPPQQQPPQQQPPQQQPPQQQPPQQQPPQAPPPQQQLQQTPSPQNPPPQPLPPQQSPPQRPPTQRPPQDTDLSPAWDDRLDMPPPDLPFLNPCWMEPFPGQGDVADWPDHATGWDDFGDWVLQQ